MSINFCKTSKKVFLVKKKKKAFSYSGDTLCFIITQNLVILRRYNYIKIIVNNLSTTIKICIIEVYLLKYYFVSYLIYKWRYYRQIILNIMVPYVDIIGLCLSVANLWEIYVMWPKCHVRWLRFHFKRMLFTVLGQ